MRLLCNSAVMSALKTLQDKIRQLEIERSQAESNLKTITAETSMAREASRRGGDVFTPTAYPDLSAVSGVEGEDHFSDQNRGKRLTSK